MGRLIDILDCGQNLLSLQKLRHLVFYVANLSMHEDWDKDIGRLEAFPPDLAMLSRWMFASNFTHVDRVQARKNVLAYKPYEIDEEATEKGLWG